MKLFVLLIVIVFLISNSYSLSSSSNSDSDSDIQYYSLTSQFQVVQGKQVPNSIAWGYFKDEMNKDGWGKLSIETVSTVSDDIAFKAAGYLEGYLTWEYIYRFSGNYFNSFFNTSDIKEIPIETLTFVSDNWEYMTERVNSSSTTDPYWIQIRNAMSQQIGLYEGYNAAAGDDYQKTFIEIYMINLYGDMGDIVTLTTTEASTNNQFIPLNRKEVEELMATTGHCTSIIKLTNNCSDLMSAHTSWADYSVMIRIYKRINIPVASTPYGSETLFSSYPGLLVSIDDFYQIRPSKLHLTETLNTILNQSLYQQIKPQSFMYWVRNLVANRLANNGFQWVSIFVENNSGTNNIQFVVLDYKLFTPYSTQLQPDLLWIVEQYPGGYQAADVTLTLWEQGYWPSYNRPYFEEVFDILGYPYYVEKFGDLFTYEYNPRANIFRRDHSTLETLEDMMNMIDYNQYKTDPFSMGYPGNSINARFDIKGGSLPSGNPIYSWFYHGTHGGIDGKAINYDMVNSFNVVARNGPTITSDCPPFNWNDWNLISHQYMPQIYNFTWISINI
ncbi:hypothetical protein ACTFIV_001702 [Dictyostelium citrinum]